MHRPDRPASRRAVLLTAAAVALAPGAALAAAAASVPSPDPDAPQAPAVRITNGVATAVLYLPDPQKGYYRATRFDYAGLVADLRVGGHSYFGRWFAAYDPKRHDAVAGPAQEFVTGQGFDAAPVGGGFIKIGVGVLKKPAEPIQGFPTLEILGGGKWTANVRPDSVEFVHVLDHPASGYGYRYTRTVSLPPGKAQMVLTHRLESTGVNALDTEMYNHNFFVFDGQPSGPDVEVRLPFVLEPFNVRGDAVKLTGTRINYVKAVEGSVRMQIKGFKPTPADYDIHVENKKTGAGVRVTSDTPLSDFVFWSNPRTTCPEAYIHVRAERGRPMTWKTTYDFYSLPPAVA